MDTQIILVYCLCDDLLKAMRHHEDVQCQMSHAEVMTVALVAALYFEVTLPWPAACSLPMATCH
jgi:hypothetical protein